MVQEKLDCMLECPSLCLLKFQQGAVGKWAQWPETDMAFDASGHDLQQKFSLSNCVLVGNEWHNNSLCRDVGRIK